MRFTVPKETQLFDANSFCVWRIHKFDHIADLSNDVNIDSLGYLRCIVATETLYHKCLKLV